MGILAGLGALVFFIGWIWMMVVAFKQGGALWAVLVFFFSWIAGVIFAIMKKDGWTQVGLMIAGMVLMVIGGVMSGNVTGSYSTTP
jgi:hypothetical protein